jgi:hypothetical protein
MMIELRGTAEPGIAAGARSLPDYRTAPKLWPGFEFAMAIDGDAHDSNIAEGLLNARSK